MQFWQWLFALLPCSVNAWIGFDGQEHVRKPSQTKHRHAHTQRMLSTRPHSHDTGESLGKGVPLKVIHDVWDVHRGMVHVKSGTRTMKPELMGAIEMMRAEICAAMKKEHHANFGSYESCVDFMKEACRPGSDNVMDGDKREKTSARGYCKQFFPPPKEDDEAKKKAEEEAQKKKEAEEAAAAAAAEAEAAEAAAAEAAAAQAAEAAAKEKAEAAAAAAAAAAESAELPGPGPAPGPAPEPAPEPAPAAADGSSPGPAPGPQPMDLEWARHMDHDMPLPVQGFEGELVTHNDMDTMTEDWQKERTPSSHLCKICAKHPSNPWCRGKCPSKEHKHKSRDAPPADPEEPVEVVKDIIPQSGSTQKSVALSCFFSILTMLAYS